MTDPRIYLGIDNCFASKRWIRPGEWMKLIRSLGLKYVEVSADTECDPLYMGQSFTQDWIEEVRRESRNYGIVIKNVYSGHGTYATSGLTHYDRRVICRFRDEWMKRQIDTGNALNAGFGFFAHGFEELLLQDAELYAGKLDEMYDTLAELAAYAAQTGMRYIGLEQMYSPHQPPWRIRDAEQLLREVYARSGSPFYITIDLGHMNGQQYFARPDAAHIQRAILAAQNGCPERNLWLGSAAARSIYCEAVHGKIAVDAAVTGILEDAGHNPQLFAEPKDWCIEQWIRELGCYSPIMHLQQSDGKSSPHWMFSSRYHACGVVKPERVLKALKDSFHREEDSAMPPVCEEIVLTFEPFISTAGNVYDLIDDIRESVAYWRKWIPVDGMYLSEVCLHGADESPIAADRA